MRLWMSIGLTTLVFGVLAFVLLFGEASEVPARREVLPPPEVGVASPSQQRAGEISTQDARAPLDSAEFEEESAEVPPPLPKGPGILVRCLDATTRAPVTGLAVNATVQYLRSDLTGSSEAMREFLFEATSDANGRFFIPIQGLISKLVLKCANDPDCKKDILWPHPVAYTAEDPEIEFPIRGQYILTKIDGRVADPAGRPLANVLVQAQLWRESLREFQSHGTVFTAHDGSFVLRREPGRYRFQVRDAEMLGDTEFEIPLATEHFVALMAAIAPSTTQAGIVVDQNEEPVARIEVRAFSERTNQYYQAWSDEQGRFVLRADLSLAGESVHLAVHAEGKEILEAPERIVFGGDEIRIQLRVMPVLRVKCVDANTGEALGAQIRATRIDGKPGPAPESVPGGLRLAPGRYSLSAQELMVGHYAVSRPSVYEMTDLPDQEVTLKLQRMHTRLLQVVDSAGNPVPRLTVHQLLPMDPQAPLQILDVPRFMGLSTHNEKIQSTTPPPLNEKGETTLMGDPTARYALILEHPLLQAAGRKVVRDVQIQDGLPPVQVVVDVSGHLMGECVPKESLDALGLSDPTRARLWLQSAELRGVPLHLETPRVVGIKRRLSLDADGRFEERLLLPGRYDIVYEPEQAGALQNEPLVKDLEIRGGGTTDRFTLDFSPHLLAAVRLRITVSGEVPRGQYVSAHRRGEGETFVFVHQEPIDSFGTTALRLRPGTYRFAIRPFTSSKTTELSALLQSDEIVVAAGSSVQEDLAFQTFAADFQAIDATSGTPLLQESLVVELPVGLSFRIHTDVHGQFRIHHLGPTPLSFRLFSFGLAPQARRTTITPAPSQEPIPVRIGQR